MNIIFSNVSLLIVLISIFLNVGAQLLLKYASEQSKHNEATIFEFLRLIIFDPHIWLGILLLAAALLFWVIALRNMPLSIIYPMSSLSIILVLLASNFFLNESLTAFGLLGIGFILLGVLILYFSHS